MAACLALVALNPLQANGAGTATESAAENLSEKGSDKATERSADNTTDHTTANATENEPQTVKRSVYLELGGASSLVGVNYDQRFKPGSKWGFRAGLAYSAPFHESQIFFYRGGENLIAAPIAVNGLFGKKNSYFEAGIGFNLGLSISHDDGIEKIVYEGPDGPYTEYRINSHKTCDFYSDMFIDLGYRYQTRKGFMFRAGISPAMLLSGGGMDLFSFMLRPYLSFGYTFGK